MMKAAHNLAFALKAPLFAGCLWFCLLQGCSSTDEKSARDPVSGGKGSGADKENDETVVSAKRVTLINSLANNKLTSHTINQSKAEQLLSSLPASSKEKQTLEGRLSAERLSRKSVSQVLGTAKRIAELEMSRGPAREISDDVKLELALAAINSRSFSLAEYYLTDLFDAKDVRVRAGAYNALGVLALRDERVPEAVAYFRQALKSLPSYKPALLNLGFTALKGGDLATAKRSLGPMSNDWFVQSGLVSINRLEGDTSRASSLCEKLLKEQANHKPSLFNCGLVEFQNKKSPEKAKELIGKAIRIQGGEASWDAVISRTLTQIGQEEAKAKREAAEAKQKAAAAAAEAKQKAAAAAAAAKESKGPPKADGAKADGAKAAPAAPAPAAEAQPKS